MALLTIAICARDEERTLKRVVDEVLKLDLPKEILIVDDGSRDRTPQIASGLSRENSQIRVLRHEASQGKGAGIQTAVRSAQGRYFAIQDADLEYEPGYIAEAVRRMESEGWDAVFGSRFLRSNPTHYPLFFIGNKCVSQWISWLTGTKITDAYTGTKVLRTDLMRSFHLESNGFEIEAEIAVKMGLAARRDAVRFLEIPIPYHPRTIEEGKKIRIADGAAALAWSWRFRFSAPLGR